MAILVLTRGSLSATFKLADILCKGQSCAKISREEVIKHAEKYGIGETGMAETGYMELQPPQFWDRHAPQRRQYMIYLKASLMDYIVNDNVIYHGHLAQFLLSDVPKILRVRVDASMEFRVNAILKESNLTKAEAKKHVFEIDSRRKNWSKFLYGVDFTDPLNYDMVLNMDKMSVSTMADIIKVALSSTEYTTNEESLKCIRDVHMKSVIMAHLAGSPRTKGMELMVNCDSDTGKIKVRGLGPIVGAEMWEKDIRTVVTEVSGVKEIDICC